MANMQPKITDTGWPPPGETRRTRQRRITQSLKDYKSTDLEEEKVQRLLLDLKAEGKALCKDRKIREACLCYEEAIKIMNWLEENFFSVERSLMAIICCNRAEQLLRIGGKPNAQVALGDCNSALEHYPDYIKALYRKAKALKRLNRHDEAKSSVLRALQHFPNNEDVKALADEIDQLIPHKCSAELEKVSTYKGWVQNEYFDIAHFHDAQAILQPYLSFWGFLLGLPSSETLLYDVTRTTSLSRDLITVSDQNLGEHLENDDNVETDAREKSHEHDWNLSFNKKKGKKKKKWKKKSRRRPPPRSIRLQSTTASVSNTLDVEEIREYIEHESDSSTDSTQELPPTQTMQVDGMVATTKKRELNTCLQQEDSAEETDDELVRWGVLQSKDQMLNADQSVVLQTGKTGKMDYGMYRPRVSRLTSIEADNKGRQPQIEISDSVSHGSESMNQENSTIALPTSDTLASDLSKALQDIMKTQFFTLACRQCFSRRPNEYGDGSYQSNFTLPHRCFSDMLLSCMKSLDDQAMAWAEVRNITNTDYEGDYYLCNEFTNGLRCRVDENICAFGHSEAEMEFWTLERQTPSIRSELYRYLKKLNNCTTCELRREGSRRREMSTENQQLAVVTKKRRWYCDYCNMNFNTVSQLHQHCALDDHKVNISADRDREWKYRSPPLTGDFKMCRRERRFVGTCKNSECIDAHSKDELKEWRVRRDHRQMKLRKGKQKNLYSFVDILLERYMNTTYEYDIMRESIDGIVVECNKDLEIFVDWAKSAKQKTRNHVWQFNLSAEKNDLTRIGLLHDVYRQHFYINDHLQVSDVSQSDNQSTVTVTWHSDMFGTFYQWVVFEFASSEPVLLRKLVVHYGIREQLDKVEAMGLTKDHTVWESTNSQIIEFKDCSDDSFEKRLMMKYKNPAGFKEGTLQIEDPELSKENYSTLMHRLVNREEVTQWKHLQSFECKMRITIVQSIKVQHTTSTETLYGEVGQRMYSHIRLDKELSDVYAAGRILIRSVSAVLIKPTTTDVIYVAKVLGSSDGSDCNVEEDAQHLAIEFSTRCCQDLSLTPDLEIDIAIQLRLDRLPFCRWHYAIDGINEDGLSILFPRLSQTTIRGKAKPFECDDIPVNKQQRLAIANILEKEQRSVTPLVIGGPFGTGKTFTIAQTILHLVRKEDNTKILLCTMTNSAADLYITRYFNSNLDEQILSLLRIYGKDRRRNTILNNVFKYCLIQLDEVSGLSNVREPNPGDVKMIQTYPLVITTLATSIVLKEIGLVNHFTHIFIDEAGQALECEAITPITLANSTTKVILAGDHKQMSPEVFDRYAKEKKFHHSLLRRVCDQYLDKLTDRQRQNYMVMLNENYRCNQSIVNFLSNLYYKGTPLTASTDHTKSSHPDLHPLVFYSAYGEEQKHLSSYFNLAEVAEIGEQVNWLVENWPEGVWGPLDVKQIGVVSVYTAQVRQIRVNLRRQYHLGGVTVDNMLNIQGKEFRALFISTVRTNDNVVAKDYDMNNINLGFLTDRKLLNTAFTRAQSLLVVVGHPVALTSIGKCQNDWRAFISECEKHGSLYPKNLSLAIIEQQVHAKVKLNPKAAEFIPQVRQQQNPAVETANEWESDDEETRDRILEELNRQLEEGAIEEMESEDDEDYNNLVKPMKSKVSRRQRKRNRQHRVDGDDTYDSDTDVLPIDHFERPNWSDRPSLFEDHTEEELQDMLQQFPDKYKLCKLHAEGRNVRYAMTADEKMEKIRINTVHNQGQALNGDEVVVEILGDGVPSGDTNSIHCKVVGIKKKAIELRLLKIACVLDEHDLSIMMPLQLNLPKMRWVYPKAAKKRRPKHSIPICQLSKEGRLRCVRFEKISNKDRQHVVFVVLFLRWSPNYRQPICAVIDRLPKGNTLENGSAILKIAHNVRESHKKDVRDEVATLYPEGWTIPDTEYSSANRLDYRFLSVFTVDSADSVDLDDALSIEDVGHGLYRVGIHIADVSFFVPKGSKIDGEAFKRATSYYADKQPPIHMLPSRLSGDLCSLRPKEDRLTVTVFVTVAEDGRVIKREVCRSLIQSKARLTYGEVEDVINHGPVSGTHDINRKIKNDIRSLHSLSYNLYAKRIGTELSNHYTNGDDRIDNPEAQFMVEQIMILANMEIAKHLTEGESPICIPLRSQLPPEREKLAKWGEVHGKWVQNSSSRQTRFKFLKMSVPVVQPDKETSRDMLILSTIWEQINIAVIKGDLHTLKNLVNDDQNHPQLAVMLSNYFQLQERGVYIPSTRSEAERDHFSLNVQPYTHFTSPIRRYIDLVVHRILVAHLSSVGQNDYNITDIVDICDRCNQRALSAKQYERDSRTLALATDLMNVPWPTLAFVESIGHQNMKLYLQHHRYISSKYRTASFNRLQPCEEPLIKEEMDSVCLKWKEHIHAATGKQQSVSHSRDERNPRHLSPEKHVIHVPEAHWRNLVMLLNSDNLPQCNTLINTINHAQTQTRLHRNQSNGNASKDITTEPHVHEQTYSCGDVVEVQLCAKMERGILVPTVQVFNATNELAICLEHRSDPIGCFEEITDESTNVLKHSESLEDYQRVWLNITAMVSASNAVTDSESTIIRDVGILWSCTKKEDGSNKVSGVLRLRSDFCEDRNIKFHGARNNVCGHVGYICVRYPMVNTGIGNTSEVQLNKFPWIAHCHLQKSIEDAYDQERPRFTTVHFEVHQCKTPIPDELFNQTENKLIPCTIELLPKTMTDRRMEMAIQRLPKSSRFIQAICLGKQIPITNPGNVGYMEVKPGGGFKPLNSVQDDAVQTALRQPFTLIQGPPGTGKTVIGVHIAYGFAMRNIRANPYNKRQVLYCGPSNKSVDVVTTYLQKIQDLSIVRIYSDDIEQKDYPIPGPGKSSRLKSSTAKMSPEHREVALHHLIRKERNNELAVFDVKFSRPDYKPSAKEIADYKRCVFRAVEKELPKYDVIVCTCSTAGGSYVLECAKVKQCIIDECGMCTEPETLVPLVSTEPAQIVFIGDHKQLRAIVTEKMAKKMGMEISMLERYEEETKMLTLQYRMHQSICEFPSSHFYGGQLEPAPIVLNRPPGLNIWPGGIDRPIVFCHIVGEEEALTVSTTEGSEQSKSNALEAEQVVRIARQLVGRHKVKQSSIVVLSQYRAQCNLITKRLRKEKLDIDVRTVIVSQGSEWDYIIFSTVRSLPSSKIDRNPRISWLKKNLGFITDQHQINVALTRAKQGLIIIGNEELLRTHSMWKELLVKYEENNCIVKAEHFL
ncbi:3'-5' exoribonuclease HELZ2-like isoform X2 [Glandiceps talaboti]